MPDRGDGQTSENDLIRLLIEQGRAVLDAGRALPPWQVARATFEAWERAVSAVGEAASQTRRRPDASPFDPAGWLRPGGAGGMADFLRWMEGPELADPFAPWRAQWKGSREWIALLAATEQMKAVMAESWIAAFGRFLEDAGRSVDEDAGTAGREAGSGSGAGPGAGFGAVWDRIEALWHARATAEIARTYRSPAFLAAQRDLIRAETDLRARLREQTDRAAEAMGLPTRAEIDAGHARVHALHRSLKAERAARAQTEARLARLEASLGAALRAAEARAEAAERAPETAAARTEGPADADEPSEGPAGAREAASAGHGDPPAAPGSGLNGQGAEDPAGDGEPQAAGAPPRAPSPAPPRKQKPKAPPKPKPGPRKAGARHRKSPDRPGGRSGPPR